MATLEILQQEKSVNIALDDHEITYVCKQDELLSGKVEKNVPDNAVIAFFRTRRGWMLIDYTGEDTYVNGLRVADAKLVAENQSIQFLELQARVLSRKQEAVTAGSKLLDPEVHCPYCMCPFDPGVNVVFCPGCETAHHLDCWEANPRGCANDLSCGYQKSLKETPQ